MELDIASLHALADPLWERFPFPVRPKAEEIRVGPLTALRMSRPVSTWSFMSVLCFAVGDTLVDTGLSSLGDSLAAYCTSRAIRRAVVTHHHEDHAGNAARLVREGIDVLASDRACPLLARPGPIHLYQHLVWGAAPAAIVHPLGPEVAIGPYTARVVPAPGHCWDQVCFHVPSEGWLFSGDVFLHERVRLFRRDEDFAATMETLDMLLGLDWDALFCAHRPRPTGGRAALLAKRQWLHDLQGRIREGARAGQSERAIARDLDLGPQGLWLTWGDASTANLVHSVLRGPRPRRGMSAR